MINSEDIKNRITALKKLKKDELIDLILDLEVDNHSLKEENADLKQKNEELREERNIALLEKDNYREKYFRSEKEPIIVQQKHNARGAGRKSKFDNTQINAIIEARTSGKSIRAIAEEFNCSPALVHKLINKH